MKKSFLLIISLFFAVVVSAQNYSYALDQIEATDGQHNIKLYYNTDDLLEWYSEITPDPWNNYQPMELRDSITYDQHGNILRTDVHQEIDGNWVHVYYIEYTYDENHNRISRTNYNNFGGEFGIQGIYTYTFDENNLLVYHEMVLVDELFERSHYTYDENNNLIEQVVEDYFGFDIWDPSTKVTYDYDENNNRTAKNYHYWMPGTESWYLKEQMIYEYDEVGNCTTEFLFDGNALASKLVYTYDMDTDIENVVMPVHPEPLFGQFAQFKNRPLKYSLEMADQNWNLIYICDYLFHYKSDDDDDNDDNDETNSVNTASFAAEVRVFPNPSTDNITVSQLGLKTVEIYDMRGTTISRHQANSNVLQIDVSNLTPGIYSVRTFDGRTPQITKIIVK